MIARSVVVMVVIASGVARADDRELTFELGGGPLIQTSTSSTYGPGATVAVGAGVGYFVTPHLAVLVRAPVMFSPPPPAVAGFVGPGFQLWLEDQAWVGASGGLGFGLISGPPGGGDIPSYYDVKTSFEARAGVVFGEGHGFNLAATLLALRTHSTTVFDRRTGVTDTRAPGFTAIGLELGYQWF